MRKGSTLVKDVLLCSKCGSENYRPARLSTSMFLQCPFVCDNCRCKDCGIVLNIECECGERHAEPSAEDHRICIECQNIRQRVANLNPEMLKIREYEIHRQDPVYGVRIRMAK